jgi:hypothetical protein
MEFAWPKAVIKPFKLHANPMGTSMQLASCGYNGFSATVMN